MAPCGTIVDRGAPADPITGIVARACCERPCRSRTAEQRDEIAAPQLIELHWIPASQGGSKISNSRSGVNVGFSSGQLPVLMAH
jgi:hypothetical protein